MFVESTWMAPIGSDVTISLVPGEGDSVGQELIQGKGCLALSAGRRVRGRKGAGVRRSLPAAVAAIAWSGHSERAKEGV